MVNTKDTTKTETLLLGPAQPKLLLSGRQAKPGN